MKNNNKNLSLKKVCLSSILTFFYFSIFLAIPKLSNAAQSQGYDKIKVKEKKRKNKSSQQQTKQYILSTKEQNSDVKQNQEVIKIKKKNKFKGRICII